MSLKKEMTLYIFSWNFSNVWMCLPSLAVPQLNFGISAEFQMEIYIICRRSFCRVVVLQRSAKKCTKSSNARAELLFCP